MIAVYQIQCNREYRNRAGRWTQCKCKATAVVESRACDGMLLYYCAKHKRVKP